jgi:phage FluMu protein gp41
MLTVKGTLPIGIEFEGVTHREYELRARRIRDSIEASEDNEAAGDSRLGLAILTRQIVQLGSIPRENIALETIMDLYDDDLAELYRAAEEVAAKLTTFHNRPTMPSSADTGTAQDGVQLS